MHPALTIVLLWLAFGASHIVLSSARLRPRLVRGLTERGFTLLSAPDAERLQPHLPASVARQQASLAQRLRDALRSGASNEIFDAVQQCFRR